MENFKIYNIGGSCCNHFTKFVDGKEIFIKEIDKKIQGVDNGYKKFFYEIEHMKKYAGTGLFVPILYIQDNGEKYSVGMENCYGGATLSDLIRNSCVNEQYFKDSFSFVLDQLYERLYSDIFSLKPAEDYINKCYFNRIIDRITYIKKNNLIEKYGFSNVLPNIIENGCYINGEYYPPLQDYIVYLQADVTLKRCLDILYTCNTHYDLCPLNILVDPDFSYNRILNFKLIDVRGENETGKEYRHFMYDMGKMLLGLDCFDIFRIFNGKIEKVCYNYQIEYRDNNIVDIKFSFLPESIIVKRYKMAYEYFWEHMFDRNFYKEQMKDTMDNLKTKFMFSHSMMYHPDIPCRIIYEKDENMAILLYMRGMIMIRKFMEEFYGRDPVGGFTDNIDIWEGV